MLEQNESLSPELVNPSVDFKESYIEAIKEFQMEGRHVGDPIKDLEEDFSGFVQKVAGYSKGENLCEGSVPFTDYWLVHGDEFIGKVSIGHGLNQHRLNAGGQIGYEIRPSKRRMGYGTKILEFALLKAKELGIMKPLVICNSTNTASIKIIEKAGGILENEVPGEGDNPSKRRYWINLGA